MSVPTQGSELASRDHGGPKAIDSSKWVQARSLTNPGLAEDGRGKKSRSGWISEITSSDVQGPARSHRAPAAGPSKPKPSQALLNGPVGLRAQLALEEAVGQAIEPRLSSVNEVKPCPQCLIPTLACKSKFNVLSNFGTPVVM